LLVHKVKFCVSFKTALGSPQSQALSKLEAKPNVSLRLPGVILILPKQHKWQRLRKWPCRYWFWSRFSTLPIQRQRLRFLWRQPLWRIIYSSKHFEWCWNVKVQRAVSGNAQTSIVGLRHSSTSRTTLLQPDLALVTSNIAYS